MDYLNKNFDQDYQSALGAIAKGLEQDSDHIITGDRSYVGKVWSSWRCGYYTGGIHHYFSADTPKQALDKMITFLGKGCFL
jgi:hypothetical protein